MQNWFLEENTYPLGKNLSGGWRYPTFEEWGQDEQGLDTGKRILYDLASQAYENIPHYYNVNIVSGE